MIRSYLRLSVMTALSLAIAACAGQDANMSQDEEEARDLTLPPVEPISAIDDEPEPESDPPPPPPARPAPRPEPEPEPEPEEIEEPEPEPLAPPSVAASTVFSIFASDTITSRHNSSGDTVHATVAEPLRDENGQILVPAGAVFSGVIEDIAPAERPGGEGRMTLKFDRVQFDGMVWDVAARVDSLGTRMKGRGVTAGDAAKVGAGAAVGALAGRVLGGNRKGTIIGAAAGTAAGVGIAAATRDIDIILDAGAAIRLMLTAPLVVER